MTTRSDRHHPDDEDQLFKEIVMDFKKEIEELYFFYVKTLAMKVASNPAVEALVSHGLGCGIQISNGHETPGEYFIISKGILIIRDDEHPDQGSRENAAALNKFLEDYVQKYGSLDGIRCFITGAFDIR